MAKKKTSSDLVLSTTEYAEPKQVGTVVNVKPVGSQVLVEILTPQEMAGTTLLLTEKADLKVPLQGYITAVGPLCKNDDYGFCVGDRVLISGTGVKAPNYDNTHRDRYFMEPHAIKSVLIEK